MADQEVRPLLILEGADGWVALLDGQATLVASSGNAAPIDAGQSLLGHLTPASATAAAAAVGEVFRNGMPQRLDLEVEAPDGHRIYDASLSRTDHRIVLLALEVTDDRMERLRLREGVRILDEADGDLHLGTWHWDPTTEKMHWSNEMFEVYGLDPEDHKPSMEDCLGRFHPDDRAKIRSALDEARLEFQPFHVDGRIHRSDGSWRALRTWGRPVVDASDHLVALMGVCMDVTEEQQASLAGEDSAVRYRAIFDYAAEGLAILDRSGRIRMANRTLQEWTGQSQEDLIGRLVGTLFQEPDHPTVTAALASIDAGPVQENLDLTDDRPAHLTLAMLPNDEVLAVLTRTDGGDGAEGGGRVKELEDETRWKTRILQVTGKQLRNPLTPLVLDLHTLRNRAGLAPEDRKLLERIAGQVQRLSRMVHDFQDMAAIERGDIILHRTTWDLDTLAREVAAGLTSATGLSGTRIRVTGHSGEVYGDRDRIHQVLMHLIENAVRFSPTDGVVTVRLREGPKVEVYDEGPGIPAESIPDLFKPFGSVKAQDVETGLGLFACRVIIEAHGGRIEAEPGPGGRFWFKW